MPSDFRAQSHSFEDLVTITRFQPNLTGVGDAQRIFGASVSPSFFSVLGVSPVLGRDFLPEEDAAKGSAVVILSHGLWQRQFGASPAIIGQKLLLDGTPYSVVGVTPESFHAPTEGQDLFRPYKFTGEPFNRKYRILSLIGRLRSGVSIAQAQAEMHAIANRLSTEYPATNKGYDAEVVSIQDAIVGNARPALLILMGAVSFVLLIACANIANLALAHSSTRRQEISIRLAIGAGRSRIVRQMITESVLLSTMGGAVGLGVAFLLVSILPAVIPADLPRLMDLRIDGTVLAFTFGLSIVSGIVFGLAPALQHTGLDLQRSLKETTRVAGSSAGTQRLRSTLVAAEVSVAVVLLIGASLLIRSFIALQAVDPGFRTSHLWTLQVPLSRDQVHEMQDSARFFRRLVDNVRTIPGVESVGAVLQLPLIGFDVDLSEITAIGEAPPASGVPQVSRLHVVTPDYFSTIGVPLLKGRFFNDRDRVNTAAVALINQRMADRFWPGQDPIGKRFRQGLRFTPGEPDVREVVGVVGDVKQFGLNTSGEPQMYVPHEQSPWPVMNLVVRTALDPVSIAGPIREQIRLLDKNVPILNAASMDQILSRSIAQPRFQSSLIGMFAALALSLAAVGIFGMVSYSVSQRAREIGVRMALGASQDVIRRMVIGEAFKPVLLGLTIGIAVAASLTRVLSEMLFAVKPLDLITFVSIPILLSAVALLASYLPARRATRQDPMIALLSE